MQKNTHYLGISHLAQPAQRALANAGIQTLEQLSQYSEEDIRLLHGIGPNALEKLRNALAERGLAFRLVEEK